MNLPAIPTTYRGVRYRSRLEARWAVFFEQLGWRAEYEPIDLLGYIPDFILRFDRPVLVECKPFIDASGDAQDAARACQRIEHGGWTGDALLVGAALCWTPEPMAPVRFAVDEAGMFLPPELQAPGATSVRIGRIRVEGDAWRDAYLARDQPCCGAVGACDPEVCAPAVWYPTPEHTALNPHDTLAARLAWSTAGNVTQWRA